MYMKRSKRKYSQDSIDSDYSMTIVVNIAFVFPKPIVHVVIILLIEIVVVVFVPKQHSEKISRLMV